MYRQTVVHPCLPSFVPCSSHILNWRAHYSRHRPLQRLQHPQIGNGTSSGSQSWRRILWQLQTIWGPFRYVNRSNLHNLRTKRFDDRQEVILNWWWSANWNYGEKKRKPYTRKLDPTRLPIISDDLSVNVMTLNANLQNCVHLHSKYLALLRNKTRKRFRYDPVPLPTLIYLTNFVIGSFERYGRCYWLQTFEGTRCISKASCLANQPI